MALHDYRKVTTVRHEYRMPAPVAFGDVQKAYAAASEDYKAVHGTYPTADDSIRLEADEESATLVFLEDWGLKGLKTTHSWRDQAIRDVLEYVENQTWPLPHSVAAICQGIRWEFGLGDEGDGGS